MKQKSSLKINKVESDSTLLIEIDGRLDSQSVSTIWDEILNLVRFKFYDKVTFDASGLTYCDTSGISLFIDVNQFQQKNGKGFEILNLSNKNRQLYNLYTSDETKNVEISRDENGNAIERLGRDFISFRKNIIRYVEFSGEMIVGLFYALLNPAAIRWKDVIRTAEKVGVDAIVIIAMSNFLVGLIIAFQAAIPMREFGAEFYVSDLVVFSTFRELGPLITATIIVGRSGSAFAAEIGTMKVNEEVDALLTMGLNPVRFLIIPKVIAALMMLPILTLIGNMFALIGGGLVVKLLGYTFVAFFNEITTAASYTDLIGGLFKSFFFALIIAGIGCKKGLETKSGASAVGDSTTSAVVTGLVLLIIVDGIFGIVYFYLGI
ncbi:MAG: ABC transporter permease [Thermodesulfobacteriota bacterium]